MESFEPKKLALIRILQILAERTDFEHPLKQEEILQILEDDYGIFMERKAVGRNIALLNEAGFEIVTTRAGSYFGSRKFEDSELRMLIDAVLSSKYITAKHSKDLIGRLCSLSNKYFSSHVKNVYSVNDWAKTENQSLFYNIELVDEAIEKGRQLKFNYNKMGVDKKLRTTSTNTVSPYQLILHNQRYYLMALNEKHKDMCFYRLDRITNMDIIKEKLTDIRSVEGYESGIDYKLFATALPYMYTDKPRKIEFIAEKQIIDHIFDWFGYDVNVEEINETQVKVRIYASVNAMEYWATQYLNYVEILKPDSLREKIAASIEAAAKKYCNKD